MPSKRLRAARDELATAFVEYARAKTHVLFKTVAATRIMADELNIPYPQRLARLDLEGIEEALEQMNAAYETWSKDKREKDIWPLHLAITRLFTMAHIGTMPDGDVPEPDSDEPPEFMRWLMQ